MSSKLTPNLKCQEGSRLGNIQSLWWIIGSVVEFEGAKMTCCKSHSYTTSENVLKCLNV